MLLPDDQRSSKTSNETLADNSPQIREERLSQPIATGVTLQKADITPEHIDFATWRMLIRLP